MGSAFGRVIKDVAGPKAFNRRTQAALLLHIVAATVFAAAANLFLFLVGPEANSLPAKHLGYDVPDWIVGTVWVLLFAGLGAARWLLAISPHPDGRNRAKLTLYLLIFCLAYPFYTVALRSIVMIVGGNIATVLAAVAVTVLVFPHSRPAAFLVSLVAIWATFATYLTANQIGIGQ